MRVLIQLICISFLISCTTERNDQTESKTPDPKVEVAKPTQPIEEVISIPDPDPVDAEYAALDSTIRDAIKDLDRKYRSTPFYVKIDSNYFYITATRKLNYDIEWFDGTVKYGVVNDSLKSLLEPYYDKIYNPNLTLLNCFEIKQNDRVGLFNYKTGEKLNPQFDYILPSINGPNNIAYGSRNNKWYEINANNLNGNKEINLDPLPILKSLSFGILSVGDNMMFDSYYEFYENDANLGRGTVIVPSYIETLKLIPSSEYTDIIVPDQFRRVDFGTVNATLKTSYRKTLGEKLTSFFVSVYEEAIDARGYQMEAKELLVYNQENNTVNSIRLGSTDNYDYFCKESNYQFVNDSILEVRSNRRRYQNKGNLYDFETKFEYFKVSKDGSINKLESNRHFDYTKFIQIRDSQFKGCFAERMNGEEYEDYNYWIYNHLSIEDLDIMRNEIFADYGYKFKSEKWQEYFSLKPWYKPLYDDVNDKLTEIDKANVKVILEVKELMLEDETKVREKKPAHYVAAG